ncbi:F-box protein, partial [Trifolium pratense]
MADVSTRISSKKNNQPEKKEMTKTDVALAKMLVDYAASRKLVLWSPSTDEFKVIPNGSIEHLILKAFPPGTVLEELPIIPTFVAIHGFAYDPVTDEYKLIRRSGFSRDLYSNYENESFWQIYS